MNSNIRQALRNALLESYKHKAAPGTKCVICGIENSKYAFHVIEFAQYSQGGHVDGSYPICEKCAPPCKKCSLPVQSKLVIQFFKKLQGQNSESVSIHWGVGVCSEHISLFGKRF